MTVTVALHWAVFPLLSVTVRVTVLTPTSEQVNALISMVRFAIPQASLLPLLMSAAAIVTLPVASRYASISWQLAIGDIVSLTVTIELHVLLFPLTSVTVRITTFGPISAQVKSVISRLRLKMPQASEEPLFISAGRIVEFPVASHWVVILLHAATGGILSSTVTSAVHMITFPLLSVTVNVTKLTPTSDQVKSVLSSCNKAIPQASVLPASISEGVIEAFPEAFS